MLDVPGISTMLSAWWSNQARAICRVLAPWVAATRDKASCPPAYVAANREPLEVTPADVAPRVGRAMGLEADVARTMLS
jgi:hypothetical protein